VTDFDALAAKLKGKKKTGEPQSENRASYGFSPGAFYKYVKERIEAEVERSNEELRKRDLPTIERVFLPSFEGKISLTFGTEFLSTVELQEAKGRIRAVIYGPPHRAEVARKDYFLDPESVDLQNAPIEEVQKVAVGFSPQRIAAEIVAALLEGRFA